MQILLEVYEKMQLPMTGKKPGSCFPKKGRLWKLHKKYVERKSTLSMTVENDTVFPHEKGIKNVGKSVIHRVIHIIHKKIPKFLHFT